MRCTATPPRILPGGGRGRRRGGGRRDDRGNHLVDRFANSLGRPIAPGDLAGALPELPARQAAGPGIHHLALASEGMHQRDEGGASRVGRSPPGERLDDELSDLRLVAGVLRRPPGGLKGGAGALSTSAAVKRRSRNTSRGRPSSVACWNSSSV